MTINTDNIKAGDYVRYYIPAGESSRLQVQGRYYSGTVRGSSYDEALVVGGAGWPFSRIRIVGHHPQLPPPLPTPDFTSAAQRMQRSLENLGELANQLPPLSTQAEIKYLRSEIQSLRTDRKRLQGEKAQLEIRLTHVIEENRRLIERSKRRLDALKEIRRLTVSETL